jgi:hypothetical protein
MKTCGVLEVEQWMEMSGQLDTAGLYIAGVRTRIRWRSGGS